MNAAEARKRTEANKDRLVSKQARKAIAMIHENIEAAVSEGLDTITLPMDINDAEITEKDVDRILQEFRDLGYRVTPEFFGWSFLNINIAW